jgi:hypothetical protein
MEAGTLESRITMEFPFSRNGLSFYSPPKRKDAPGRGEVILITAAKPWSRCNESGRGGN